jgi:hypothetical protein
MAALGIIFNFISVRALLDKNFFKSEKDDSAIIYHKMFLYCLVNMFICKLYLFKFTNRCIDPLRLICINSIVTHRNLRIFLTIMFNFIGCSLKTYSYFVFFIISIQRYYLITNSKFSQLFRILKHNQTSICLFLVACSVNIINIFKHSSEIDYKFLYYPLVYTTDFDVYFYINNFILFITDILLFFIQSFVDIKLLKFIIKNNKMNKRVCQKLSDSKEKTEKRMKLMIVSNGVVFFLTHTLDVSILILKSIKEFYFRNVIFQEILFFVMDDVFDLLFIINCSANILIFYIFNMKFRKSFNLKLPSFLFSNINT